MDVVRGLAGGEVLVSNPQRMEYSIKLALHRPSDKVVHVDEAENGLACNCVCETCGENLQAVQGEKRDWHFRHDSNSTCQGGQESALHKLGKQILLEARALEIPNFGRFEYADASTEQVLDKTQFRSDVCLKSTEKTIHVEILVTHFNEPEKEKHYKTQKIESVEINLFGFFENFSKVKFEEIKQAVLDGTDCKRVIYWEVSKEGIATLSPEPKKVSEIKKEEGEPVSLWGALIVAAVLFFRWRYRKQWRQPNRRSRWSKRRK